MASCIFCKILEGALPSSGVCESELTVAFLDINPINPGHTLVVPRRHVVSFTDLSPEELWSMSVTGRRVALAQKVSLKYEGVTLSLADGEAAGQEVPHVHLHVIPRRSGDGFGWKGPSTHRSIEDREGLKKMAARLRAALASE
jgi:histidine triad (HIT) family protein